MWTLYCYDDGVTPDIWERWFFDDPLVTDYIRARHAVVWKFLKPAQLWQDRDLVKASPVDGVMEIRILIKRELQWRLGGVWGPKQREFIVLGAFYHKTDRYYPNGVLSEIGKRRDKLVASKFAQRIEREPPRIIDRA